MISALSGSVRSLARRVRRRSRALGRKEASTAVARLAALTAAGVATGDAIASSLRSLEQRRDRTILLELHRAIRRGAALSAAMTAGGMPFREAEIAVVRAGERGGSMPRALALLAERMERESGGKRRLASALAYPCILFAGALGALSFLSIVVLPSFTTMYSGHELPASTRALIAFGDGVRAWGLAVVCSAAALSIVLASLRRRHERFARLCDHLSVSAPGVSSLVLPRMTHDACSLLAMLLEAGCEAEEALALAARAAPNRTIASRMNAVLRSLRHGVPLSVAWNGARLDHSGNAAPLLEIAEATGSYATAFRRLAELEGAAAEHALSGLCRLAEPAAVVAMAVAVGGGVLAVYQPMLGSASLLLGGTP